MPNNPKPALNWKDYEKQYDFIAKFGARALLESLPENGKVDGAFVLKTMNASLGAGLDAVGQALKAQQNPRGDNVPEMAPEQALGAQAQQRYKQPGWQSKMDLAADPKNTAIANRVANMLNNDPNNPAILTALTEMIKNNKELRNELKLRNAPRPSPRANIRPDKP